MPTPPKQPNPVIGHVDCPMCGIDNEVKRNMGGAGCGYFYCTGCGYHGKWTKAETVRHFIDTQPPLEDFKDDPQAITPKGNGDSDGAGANRSGGLAEGFTNWLNS